MQEPRQTLRIIGVAISSHIISFWISPIFGHFRITQRNQNQLIQSRKISCNWAKKNFSIISKEKILRADRKKSLYR